MKRALDTVVNVALITVATMVCVWIAAQLRERWMPQAVAGPNAYYNVGDTAPVLDGVDFSKSPASVVLFVRSGCHFCSESMSFYQALADEPDRRFSIIAASSEPVDVTNAYLKGYNVRVDGTASFALDKVRISATPTLLLIGHDGRVLNKWVGKQSADGEARIREAAATASRITAR